MRKVVSDSGLADRIEILVDPDSEPVDWDDALADFLLAYVRQQSRSPSGTPATAVEFPETPEAERLVP